jgi:hypothetical protein
MTLRSPAPQAGASASFATPAVLRRLCVSVSSFQESVCKQISFSHFMYKSLVLARLLARNYRAAKHLNHSDNTKTYKTKLCKNLPNPHNFTAVHRIYLKDIVLTIWFTAFLRNPVNFAQKKANLLTHRLLHFCYLP